MAVEENKQMVRRAFEGLMSGDLNSIDSLLTPDAVIHQCGFLEPMPVRTFLSRGGPAEGRIADRALTIERIIGEGDLVALHWTTTGRYTAPDEPEHDGRPLRIPWMTFVRLDNGTIAEIWNIRDTATLETQLGQPAIQGGR